MNTQQQTYFKEILLKKRSDILISVNAKKSEEEISAGRDEADLAQEAFISSMISSLFDREKQQIKQINFALNKFKDNSYGQCEECEEDIAEKRLKSMPWASLCISCQENLEKEQRQFCK